MQIIFIIQKKETQNNEELIIFNCKKNTIITAKIGNAVTIYSNDSIRKNLNSNLWKNIPEKQFFLGKTLIYLFNRMACFLFAR